MQDNDDTDKFSDQEIVARTIYGEARGEPYQGKQGVANVIINRAKHPRWWGQNTRNVCLHPFQFSCWNDSDRNRPVIMAVTEDDPIYGQCIAIAGLAISHDLGDVTCGADSYLVTGTPAKWSDGLNPTATIGKHSFYRTI